MPISATLSVLESPGGEAQVNELRKVSIKLSKALNLQGIRSMVERVAQKNNIQRCVPLAFCLLPLVHTSYFKLEALKA
jgi:chromatin assembly factor 1 subunit A